MPNKVKANNENKQFPGNGTYPLIMLKVDQNDIRNDFLRRFTKKDTSLEERRSLLLTYLLWNEDEDTFAKVATNIQSQEKFQQTIDMICQNAGILMTYLGDKIVQQTLTNALLQNSVDVVSDMRKQVEKKIEESKKAEQEFLDPEQNKIQLEDDLQNNKEIRPSKDELKQRFENKSLAENVRSDALLEYLFYDKSKEELDKIKAHIADNKNLTSALSDLSKYATFKDFGNGFEEAMQVAFSDGPGAINATLRLLSKAAKLNPEKAKPKKNEKAGGNKPRQIQVEKSPQELEEEAVLHRRKMEDASTLKNCMQHLAAVQKHEMDLSDGTYTAAAFIVLHNQRHLNEKDKDQFKEFESVFKQEVETLSKDSEFRYHIRHQLSKLAPVWSPGTTAENARSFEWKWKNYTNQLQAIASKESETWYFNTYDRHPKESILQWCDNRIDEARNEAPFDRMQAVTAADLIIAHTLKNAPAEISFFSNLKKNGYIQGEEAYEGESVKNAVNNLREQLIKDPILTQLLLNNTPQKDFYQTYLKEVKLAMKQRIEADKREERNAEKQAARDTYYQAHSHTFTDEEKEFVQKLYRDLVKYNASKSRPSREMTQMKNALLALNTSGNPEQFQMTDTATFKVINDLRKASLTYYNERKGVILDGPKTDDGKGRFAVATKLARFTDSIIQKASRNFNEAEAMKGAPQSQQPQL